ncbi:hypothetical protein JZ751_019928 [Albula glossodonta]|uniref:Uncharacterized protein n=1 Tax=Albula glossodonta TaxID=121402 RepID=A0A8T2MSW7_9TELE|nr:hypothetical protein JZ751_019928 [Albula glossodonta]
MASVAFIQHERPPCAYWLLKGAVQRPRPSSSFHVELGQKHTEGTPGNLGGIWGELRGHSVGAVAGRWHTGPHCVQVAGRWYTGPRCVQVAGRWHTGPRCVQVAGHWHTGPRCVQVAGRWHTGPYCVQVAGRWHTGPRFVQVAGRWHTGPHCVQVAGRWHTGPYCVQVAGRWHTGPRFVQVAGRWHTGPHCVQVAGRWHTGPRCEHRGGNSSTLNYNNPPPRNVLWHATGLRPQCKLAVTPKPVLYQCPGDQVIVTVLQQGGRMFPLSTAAVPPSARLPLSPPPELHLRVDNIHFSHRMPSPDWPKQRKPYNEDHMTSTPHTELSTDHVQFQLTLGLLSSPADFPQSTYNCMTSFFGYSHTMTDHDSWAIQRRGRGVFLATGSETATHRLPQPDYTHTPAHLQQVHLLGSDHTHTPAHLQQVDLQGHTCSLQQRGGERSSHLRENTAHLYNHLQGGGLTQN